MRVILLIVCAGQKCILMYVACVLSSDAGCMQAGLCNLMFYESYWLRIKYRCADFSSICRDPEGCPHDFGEGDGSDPASR